MPPHLANQDSEFIVEKPPEKAIYCTIFVGNTLTALQMRNPTRRLGGKLLGALQDYPTVPNAFIPSCQITRLKTAMRGINQGGLEPKTTGLYVQQYTAKNVWNSLTGQFEDATYGAPNTDTEFLVFKEIRPSQQLEAVLGHKSTGVVLIDDGINSASDITEAQYHYFPNWNDVLLGTAPLPERLAVLEEHLRERQAKSLSPEMRAVGNAFLASCDSYRTWGTGYVTYQGQIIKETEKTPGARYDEISERLFKQLDLTREDLLIQDIARASGASGEHSGQIAQALASLAETQKLMAQVQAEQRGIVVAPVVEAPPAPQTVQEAVAEFKATTEENIVTEESSFTDMTVVTDANPAVLVDGSALKDVPKVKK